MAQDDSVCRRLMSMPRLDAVLVFNFRSAVDDPFRFTSSKKVGPWVGLMPCATSPANATSQGASRRLVISTYAGHRRSTRYRPQAASSGKSASNSWRDIGRSDFHRAGISEQYGNKQSVTSPPHHLLAPRGVCQTSCPPISCSVSDFRGADFVFRVEPDRPGGLPVARIA